MSRPLGALKVLLVTPRYAPAIGGVEWHTQMLANELRRQGVSVEVACTDPGARAPRAGAVDGITVRRFPTIRGDSTFFVSPSLMRWVVRHAGDYDIVHAHSYHTPLPLLAAVATRRARVPFVVTPHFHGSGHTPARRLLHVPYRFAGAWAIQRADAVVCVSNAERTLLGRLVTLNKTVAVIPNGIDTDEVLAAEPISPRPSARIVLVVGRLERYKGAARVIEASKLLPTTMDLVVIGDGPDRANVFTAADEAGIGKRFQWRARVQRSELLSWYRTADVFVSMSAHEAFGLTLLEAVVGGARAIASDIPAHREVAQFLPPGSVEFMDLAASSAELAAGVVRAEARGRVLDASATVPSWEEVALRTLDVYHRVARPKAT